LKRAVAVVITGLLLTTGLLGVVATPARADSIVGTITGFNGPFGVAVNPAGTLAYVTNSNNNTVSVVALDQPASGSAVVPAVPDKMQAVARPITGCATLVSDASINWSGIAGTGWNPSWAQWANSGLGGDVCVRMLGYNLSTNKWFAR
jgi:DNA-binding beta-propeller fold protein YncE